MSIEWFMLMDSRPRSKMRRDPLSDPLEDEDWRGLGWAASAFARLTRQSAPIAPQKDRKDRIAIIPAGSTGRI